MGFVAFLASNVVVFTSLKLIGLNAIHAHNNAFTPPKAVTLSAHGRFISNRIFDKAYPNDRFHKLLCNSNRIECL